MRRRAYLAGSIGLVGSLAGCTDVLGGSDDSGSNEDRGPTETIDAFYEAALNGDGETARSYFHPEAELPPPPDPAIEEIQQSSLRLEETAVVEQSESQASVEATVSQEAMGGERREQTVRYLLRRSDGEWLIYDQPPSDPSGSMVPRVSWDASERTEDGAVTAVVFVHAGGDNVDATTLSAIVDGTTVGAPGTASEVTAGTGVVVPFDGGGESVGPGQEVRLTWTEPDGGSSHTLASFTLTSETAGSPAGQLRIE